METSPGLSILLSSSTEQFNGVASSRRENTAHPRHPLFQCYDSRWRSYNTWSQFHQFNTAALADAGFYNIGLENGIIIRCFFCGIELANPTYNDDPLLEHVKKSPNCGYLQQKVGERSLKEYHEIIRNETLSSPQPDDMVHAADRPSSSSSNPGQWSESDNIRNPQYQAYNIRLSSFDRWPSEIRQRSEQVAAAGFYYTGLQDIVRCFACDGELKNWDREIGPWIEHARRFPQCPFVKDIKGQEFITRVRRMIKDADEDENEDIDSTLPKINPVAGSSSMRTWSYLQFHEENVENVLETDAAKRVLDMGYSRDIVAMTINELLTKGNVNYASKDIMDIILEEEDRTDGDMNPSPKSRRGARMNDSKQTLIQENKRLRRRMLCVVCKASKKDTCLLPCTHLCLCSHCADKTYICPLCYHKIREKIKTHVV